MAERDIGFYFFENEESQPEKINGALYRTMPENSSCPEVEDNQEVWFPTSAVGIVTLYM